jgi:hypothetical protein
MTGGSGNAWFAVTVAKQEGEAIQVVAELRQAVGCRGPWPAASSGVT